MKELPIGISTFESIVKGKMVYDDKTQVIYELIKSGNPKRYFFSRPRRFGKSLTCSTFYAIFEGRKDLFEDLWIAQSDYIWQKRPVILFDFSQISHKTPQVLIEGLHAAIDMHAEKYNITLQQKGLKEKLIELVTTLGTKIAPVAIIIDEYDKPITNLMDNIEQAEQSRDELRDFYGTLKGASLDANIHFLFITGVSKFSKIALFSELNNLDDLTNDDRAAALVGYTDQEVDFYLTEHIQMLADKRQESYNNTRHLLKEWYNGYRFSNSDITVYNPFSLHNCLTKKTVSNYWFASGTPNFLMKFIKKNPSIASDIETIDGSFFAQSNLETFNIDVYYQKYKTLLLQAGYLTFVSAYDSDERGYTIGYPNEEVRYSMTEQIMEHVGHITPEQFSQFSNRFRKALAADDFELFCKHLQDFIKLIPHNIRVDREKFYHQVFFMICVLFGKRPAAEVATEEGFMDLLLEGTTKTFVVELKRNSTPDIALAQIEEKRYWEPYDIVKTKTVVLAGITFNKTDQGIIVECKMKELSDNRE